ncbi:hypothetical protein D3C71_1499610 [compost metagenome]
MQGKALLALLLRTSDDHSEGDQSSLISNYREDTDSVYVPQTNFAEPILRQVIARPELLDGFAGALSHALATVDFEGSWNDIASATYKACRKLNPYSEEVDVNYGGPSLDEQLAEAVPSAAPTAASAPAIALHFGTTSPVPDEWGDFDPYCLLLQARDVAETAANDDGSEDSLWGLHSLIEKSVEKVSKVVEGSNADSEDVCSRASDELAGVLGVLHAVNTDGLDNPLLYAVESLLLMAKRQIDANVERLIQARLGRGAA